MQSKENGVMTLLTAEISSSSIKLTVSVLGLAEMQCHMMRLFQKEMEVRGKSKHEK